MVDGAVLHVSEMKALSLTSGFNIKVANTKLPAHIIAQPRSLVVDHIGSKVCIKPSLVRFQEVGNRGHRGCRKILDLVQRCKIIFHSPEPILCRSPRVGIAGKEKPL